MFHSVYRALLIGLLFTPAVFPVASASEVSGPSSARVLKLNVSPNGYPPYTIVEKGDRFRGIVWDVTTVICERLGYQLEALKVPRKRVDGMLTDGMIDATPRAKEWTEEPDNFVFTIPIVQVSEVFFSRAERAFEYFRPADLESMTVLTHLGYKYPNIRDMFTSGKAKRFDVPKDQDIFRFLMHGDDFDVAVSDRLVGQWMIRKNGWQGQFHISKQPLTDVGLRLMLRPDMAAFVSQYNEELGKMKDSGELESILAAYR
ncbi:substrate-binding periplasmic protein [Marinobacter sp. V034]|uniref:substrate-binding periplasmic protein n=1 Tax=Marinobacter sp. V034 TaxID=3459610 RepID=UPI004044886E